MTTSIIIPQRGHQQKFTEPLVASIQEHEPDVEILVIDDGVGEQASPGDIPGVRVISNSGEGVTAAFNIGCQRASGDHFILLNNDVICSGPFAEKLTSRAGSGIAGAKMRLDPDLKIHVLEGWCLAFSRRLFDTLNGFDRRFSMYFSDTDFQYRAHKAGHPLTSVPLPLKHLGHRTAHDGAIIDQKKRRAIWKKDCKTFQKKWGIGK